ncbi:Temperature dependent protein affecting M2 dsRNA replication [Trypanosoma melophagium]|uniref:Temperature dependent protein affecting M2 dsRNA replication n=1 Tax=Trypanosoma melophagium TaxID=715481 RepID=UPI00351A83D6|nr:Temperature dependent protein affecting M2 dsRNA replication [Trypanosoma melophagium]
MRRAGGNRNADRQGRGQGQQGSPMGPPGPSMGYPQHQHQHHQYHHHHQHHQQQQQPHHHHHHNSSYSNVYDGSRPPPHSMQQMPPHGFGQGGGGGGNGWNTPQQQMPMYNQGYGGPMGPGSVSGYGDMGGAYPDMQGGQYPPSPSHMGGVSGMSYMRNPPTHGGVPPNGPLPGAYGGLPGQGTPHPMGYGRGGQPPMDPMQQGGAGPAGGSGMYGGYADNRLSPPPQVGYGPNMGAPLPPPPPPPPPPPQGPYVGGGPMSLSRHPGTGVGAGIGGGGGGGSGVYPGIRGRSMMNDPMTIPNAPRHPIIGSPDTGIVGGGMSSGRFNQQPGMMSPGILSPAGLMAGGNMPPNQPPLMPTQMDLGDPSHLKVFDPNAMTESLYEFLRERDLVSVGPLSYFFPEGYDPENNPPLKIAVDGNFCLASLRDELRKRDPLWFLHSTLPEELLGLVWHHVEWMRNLKLEPIWVFNGLSVSGDVETFLTTEGELRARDVVWSKLEEGAIPAETEIQTAFDQPLGEDVQMAVVRYLQKELNVLTVTAPFLNWAQMVAFHKEGVADILLGPPEMLLLPYDEMKFIMQIDVSNTNVHFLDRDKVLRALFPHHVTETSTKVAGDRLMDFGLITATNPALSSTRVALNLTMQEVYEELSSKVPKYKTIKEFIGENATVPDVNKKKSSPIIKHFKGRGYLRYCSVFSTKTPDNPMVYLMRVLEPTLTDDDMPGILGAVLGNRVPLSLFYLQFVGLLPVHIMTVVTQLYLRDECPVSDTKDYHEKLEFLMTMRSQIIAQIFNKIADEKSSKRTESFSWVRWYDPILSSINRPKDLIDLDEWDVSHSDEVRELDDNHLENYSIASVLSFSTEAARPVREQNKSSPCKMPVRYHGKKETLFAILLKVFDFLGYFSHSATTPDMVGEGEEGMSQMINEDVGAPQPICDGNTYNEGIGMQNDDLYVDEGLNEYPTVYFPTFLMNTIKQNPQSFQTAFVILTELLRVGIIGSLPCRYINPVNQKEAIPMEGQEANSDSRVLLASRIACLVTLPYRRPSEDLPFIWAPVYSRHLCAFTVMVRAMCRCLRELVEVITTTVFLSGSSSCSLSELASFSSLLPFGDVPSAIGGLLLHYVLVFPADYQANLTTREERIEYLQQKFRDIPDLGLHLRTVMTFTLRALYLINAYSVSDKGAVLPNDLLNDNRIEHTIELMWEKWADHFDDDPPEDIHGLYGGVNDVKGV